MRPHRWLTIVALAALTFTLLANVTPVLDFAYRGVSLHVAVETAAALIALLTAQLVYARFRRSLDRTDLLLMAALVLFAATNLAFSAIPAAADAGNGSFLTWVQALGGAAGAAVLAAAAWTPPAPVPRPAAAARRALVACGLGLAVLAAAVALAGNWLPRAIDPALAPDAKAPGQIVGAGSLLALQLVIMALFATAAVGLGRRAERTGDQLTLWFSIGAALGAFARLNYFFFPSVYSEYFSAGDVLRVGLFACLLVGGLHEIRGSQRELERAAVAEERRRLAREIHDGMAQDLAFIVQQTEALAARDEAGSDEVLADLATAARRTLDESRIAIGALVRPTDEPLVEAVALVAAQASARFGTTAETRGVAGLEVAPAKREALLRIVGEAVTNAARHARPEHIEVELADEPRLHVRIADDGVGFDPELTQARNGHHGINGMRERAEQLGGELQITSRPGEGTEIVVFLT